MYSYSLRLLFLVGQCGVAFCAISDMGANRQYVDLHLGCGLLLVDAGIGRISG